MPHQSMPSEEFELAARELSFGGRDCSNASQQVGNVTFTAPENSAQSESNRKAPATYFLQIAEVLEEVSQVDKRSNQL